MRRFVDLYKFVHARGFFHLLSANFLVQFLGFGTSLGVAKFLTPIELGEIRIIQSYAAIFVIFSGFGFNSAILKMCSEKRDLGEKEALLRYSFFGTCLTTVAALGVLVLLSLTGIITSSRHLAIWLIIYAAVIPFAAFTSLFMSFLQALKRIKEMARAQAMVKTQSFVLIVVGTYFWGLQGFVFGTIGAYCLGLIPLMRQVGSGFLERSAVKPASGFSHIAIFSLLSNCVYAIGQYGDVFILDHFSGDRDEIGYYALATIFVLAATQVTNTVGSIVVPYFSERSNEENWVRKEVRVNQARLTLLSIAVAFFVFILGWVLVKFFYGYNYNSSLLYLSILLIKYVLYSSCVVMSMAIFGIGYVRFNFVSGTIFTFLALVLSFFWIQKFGVVGVAWAQVIASFFLLSIVSIFSKICMNQHFSRK